MHSIRNRLALLIGKLVLAAAVVQIHWSLAVSAERLQDLYMRQQIWQNILRRTDSIGLATWQSIAFGLVATGAVLVMGLVMAVFLHHGWSEARAIRRMARSRRIPTWGIRAGLVC